MKKIDKTKKCRVYFNLHKKVFSVQQKNEKGNWIVVDHTPFIELIKVVFKVSEAGRQRVLKERRKNVHAFVEGFLASESDWLKCMDKKEVSYNPYKAGSFMSGKKAVQGARFATLIVDKVEKKGKIKAEALDFSS